MIRLTIMHGYLYTTVHDIVKVEDDSIMEDGYKKKYGTKIYFARDGMDRLLIEWVSESVEKVNELISSASNGELVRSYEDTK